LLAFVADKNGPIESSGIGGILNIAFDFSTGNMFFYDYGNNQIKVLTH
jgi:hypothetical protein